MHACIQDLVFWSEKQQSISIRLKMIVCLVQNFQFPFFPHTQTKQNRNTLAYFTFHFVLETHKTVFKDIYRISCDIKNIQPKVYFQSLASRGRAWNIGSL